MFQQVHLGSFNKFSAVNFLLFSLFNSFFRAWKEEEELKRREASALCERLNPSRCPSDLSL